MTDTMGTVKRDFLPDDIVHLLKENNIDGPCSGNSDMGSEASY